MRITQVQSFQYKNTLFESVFHLRSSYTLQYTVQHQSPNNSQHLSVQSRLAIVQCTNHGYLHDINWRSYHYSLFESRANNWTRYGVMHRNTMCLVFPRLKIRLRFTCLQLLYHIISFLFSLNNDTSHYKRCVASYWYYGNDVLRPTFSEKSCVYSNVARLAITFRQYNLFFYSLTTH